MSLGDREDGRCAEAESEYLVGVLYKEAADFS